MGRMCDTLTTRDGAELSSVADARRYGIDVPAHLDGADCMCALELPDVLERHPATWRRTAWNDGYDELDDNGRSWEDGYDLRREVDGVIIVERSDGRQPATIERVAVVQP
jgi:hypothetical protein